MPSTSAVLVLTCQFCWILLRPSRWFGQFWFGSAIPECISPKLEMSNYNINWETFRTPWTLQICQILSRHHFWNAGKSRRVESELQQFTYDGDGQSPHIVVYGVSTLLLINMAMETLIFPGKSTTTMRFSRFFRLTLVNQKVFRDLKKTSVCSSRFFAMSDDRTVLGGDSWTWKGSSIPMGSGTTKGAEYLAGGGKNRSQQLQHQES